MPNGRSTLITRTTSKTELEDTENTSLKENLAVEVSRPCSELHREAVGDATEHIYAVGAVLLE